jgi:oxygen-independent coproporphyrinogen-3 oxidase
MYETAIDTLTAAGYEQYEISNFARPGRRCRHNEIYWKGLPFYGFGPGAARYIDGRRETNHRSVRSWLKLVLAGESAIAEIDTLSQEEKAREAIVIGLRACDGIDKDEFRDRTGYELDALARPTIEHYVELGLLEEVDSRLRLTREGRFLADTVFVDFL